MKKELDELPKQIEALEIELTQLQELTSSTEFHAQDHTLVQAKMNELKQLDQQLQAKYQRWDEVESM